MAFQDLITSFRGLGFVGILLSLAILGSLVFFGRLALDEQFAGGAVKIEHHIKKNETALETIKERKAHFAKQVEGFEQREKDAKELADVQMAIQQAKDANAVASSNVAAAQEELQDLDESYYSYKIRYRNYVRQQAVGTELDKLVTQDGKTYEKVKIKSIEGLGMNITHRDGSKRIPFENLPREMQIKYQYDKGEALAQQKREADIRQQHRLAQIAADREAGKNNQKRQEERAREEYLEKQKSIQNLAMAIETLNRQIYSLQSRISMESSKTVSRAPILQKDLEKLQRTKREYENRLRKLSTAP